MNKLVLFSIVIIEILIGLCISYWVYWRIAYPASTTQTVKIPKDKMFNPSQRFLHYYEDRPEASWSAQPEWLPYEAYYTINKEGLNQLADYPLEKQKNTIRIVTMGDSFTFGAYVNTRDNYPEQLQGKLDKSPCRDQNNIEIINIGMSGFDLSYAIERFRLHALQYKPDVVLWLINEHNIYTLLELEIPIRKAIEKSQSAQDVKNHLKERVYYYASQKGREQVMDSYGKDYILKQQLEYFDWFSSLYQGPLVLISFRGFDEQFNGFMSKLLDSRANTYLYNELPKLTELNGILPDGHPNQIGYTIIASSVYSYLFKSGLLNCN